MSNFIVDRWRDEVFEKGKYIWELIYPVRIASSATLNEFELKNYGRRSTGDRQRDLESLNERVVVYITIDAMVEHYRVGTRFEFVDNANAQHVYDIVVGYLNAWVEQLTKAVNVSAAPVDDLMLMDRFAADLLQATVNFQGAKADPSLRFFEKFSLGIGLSEATQIKEKGLGQHNSMADVFSKAMFGAAGGSSTPANPKQPSTAMSRWK